MQNNIYYSYNQLIDYIKKLDTKIQNLEKTNNQLQQVVENIKKQPPINVERIDYHFDQLKIERLEGTLNIGFNPADLQGADEISFGNQFSPYNPAPADSELNVRLYNELYTYLDEKLPKIVNDTKEQFGLNLDDSYTDFIKQDILKQLKGRIDYHIKQANTTERTIPADQLFQHISETLKNDIQQAVKSFFSQFPMKDDRKEKEDDL